MLTLFQNFSDQFLAGFGHTLLASAIALIASFVIGISMAVGQTSHNKLLSTITTIYIEVFRNIPLLVIVMFFYVVVPLYGIKVTGYQAGIIGLSLYTSSFVADVVKSGITSIPKGQKEAGFASGLSQSQVTFHIVLPQAINLVLPTLGNQIINLVKNSSILAMVAGLDIMYQGDLIASQSFNVFSTYIIVGLFYLLITIPLSLMVKHWENQQAKMAR
ncbi:amino acid ABC transporter permease [Eremococcus coleocola]|uniref:ABC transporter, permease protein n=1 Tax=Eremococcus coleocola ACS-139-V-Col8 TaxID=908337 RepID=E4KRD3_9LACT|nr:amino acid ABC transporter permease [Eremococcus coleocola]EFR30525.1 ABC transporter, permease protein [Eremococcus coleocola ACS-139-V-Col8]